MNNLWSLDPEYKVGRLEQLMLDHAGGLYDGRPILFRVLLRDAGATLSETAELLKRASETRPNWERTKTY